MVYAGAQWLDTTWEDALAIYAGLMKKVLDTDGSQGIVFSCFDHGGGGGGFENTWGTGKLMFSAPQTPMVRIHNRPTYNSECHAAREMGVGELNNSYEDAELADTIFAIGTNAYETQTNYFLAHSGSGLAPLRQRNGLHPYRRSTRRIADRSRAAAILREVADEAVHRLHVRAIPHVSAILTRCNEAGRNQLLEMEGQSGRRYAERLRDLPRGQSVRRVLDQEPEHVQSGFLRERGQPSQDGRLLHAITPGCHRNNLCETSTFQVSLNCTLRRCSAQPA